MVASSTLNAADVTCYLILGLTVSGDVPRFATVIARPNVVLIPFIHRLLPLLSFIVNIIEVHSLGSVGSVMSRSAIPLRGPGEVVPSLACVGRVFLSMEALFLEVQLVKFVVDSNAFLHELL